MERAIRTNAVLILAANAEDVAEVRAGGASSAFIDRLTLTDETHRCDGRRHPRPRAIPDPVGIVTESWQRPNGMIIERVRVPLGVVAVIFLSLPQRHRRRRRVVSKSGNAVILRGGSDNFRVPAARSMNVWRRDCAKPICRRPRSRRRLTRDRAAVGLLLTGLNGGIDVVVPRGGKSLVARVEAEARVPVFAHREGVNHVYVDHAANLEMAKSIVLNAKMRRPGVCGAAETLLIDRAVHPTTLKPLVEDADRRRLRGARRRCRAADRPQGEAGRRRRLGHRKHERRDHRGQVVDGVDEAIGIFMITVRTTPMRL